MSFRRSKVPKFIPILSLLILLVLGPIVFSFLQNASGVEAAWVDDNFSYRNAIPITSHTAAENNVYVSATIDTSASGQFQADCGDLRFTTVGGDILPYYIVSGCVSASTVVHVFFKSMPAGAQTLYYYYGNPSAANGFNSADFATVASSYALGTVASQEKGGAPIAYWKFDEGTGTTTKDSSSNSNTGTITNAIWKEESLCANGKCLYYDGSGDYVTVSDPSNGVLDFGTSQNFTVAAWAKIQNPTAYHSFLGKCGQDNTCPGYEFFLNGSTIYFRMTWTGGPQYGTSVTTTYDIRDNNWHYMVAVVDRTAEKVYLYGDGKLLNGSGGSITGVGNIDNSNDLTIGTAGAGAWKGFLDDAKLYNYARTAAQIKSDFKSRGTAKGTSVGLGSKISDLGSLSNGLVGYWKMDEVSGAGSTLADSSGNSNTGTAVLWGGGNTSTDSAHVAGKFGNSFSFDGGDDYIQPPNIGIPTSQTVSGWFKYSAAPATNYLSIMTNWWGSFGKIGIYSTGRFYWAWIESDNTNHNIYPSAVISTGVWHFFAATYDKPSKTARLYVDGSEVGSTTSNDMERGGNYFKIGHDQARLSGYNEGWPFNGSLDEIRFYNRALSPREVRDLYNYAPGPLAYFNFEEGSGATVLDSSGNSLAATWAGTNNHYTSGMYGKGGNLSTTSDYAYSSNGSFNMGYNDFTISTWIKTNTTTRQYIIDKGAGDGLNGFRFETSTDFKLLAIIGGPSSRVDIVGNGKTINDGAWHYISVVYVRNGNGQIYIDGVASSSPTNISSLNGVNITNGTNFAIGSTGGGAGSRFTGLVDEVRIYNYARTQKQIVEDMNAGHPAGGSPVGSQVGYWRFDEGYGTNTSNSGNGGATYNATLASSPNAPTWNNEGKYGKALNFDGSNDYATINTSLPTLTEGSISMWVKRTATTGTYQMLFTDSGSQFEMAWVNASTLTFYVNNVGVSTSTAASLNIWYHITGTFSETGNYQRIYVNGVLANSSTYPGDATTATRYFGSRAGSYPFAGSIDEIKVYNSALTSDEIQLDYNRGQAMVLGTLSDTSGLTGGSVASSSASAEYCVPGSTDTCTPPVARWDFEEKSGTNAYDSSGNGNTGTLTNGPTWSLGKVGAGINFAGDNDFISTGIATHPTSFTVEAWANTDVTDATIDTIFSKFTSGPYNGFFLRHSSGSMTAQVYNAGTGYVSYATITPGVWNHWAMTFDGSTIRLYKDGVQTDSDSGTMGTTTQTLVIGGNYTGPSEPFDGKIDNVKYFNYARTPAQIAWDYNRGAPVGHWRMDECQGATAKDSSGNGNNGTITIGASGTQTAVGTCTTSGTAWFGGVTGKFNSSLNFDGTDDQITGTISNTPATNQVTISYWIKPGSVGTQQNHMFLGTSGSARIVPYMGSDNIFYCWNTVSQLSSGVTISTGTWYNLDRTYDGTNLKVYVNGSLRNTSTISLTLAANNFTIGADNGSWWTNGQIDDVRIYNYALTASQIKSLFNGGAAVKFGPVTGSP